MLSKKLYFIHNFDERLHYSIYYSLLKFKDSDGIYINDSVQGKKCNRGLGRWNFIVANKDYSCGIYQALELIRQSIFSAVENKKDSVDIALVPAKSDSDVCYVVNHAKESENSIECECDKRISKQIFFNIIKPVLEEVFKKTNYPVKTKVFKDKVVYELLNMNPKAAEMEIQLIASGT